MIFYQELIDVLIKSDLTFEIIFVDNGSTNKSLAILSELQENGSRIVVISFRRNFGQTAALSAGFD